MKNTIKFYTSFALSVLIFVNCNAQKKSNGNTIVLKNTSTIEVPQKAISIKRNQLSVNNQTGTYPVLIYKNDTIPAQVNDLDGDGKWDELFIVTDFAPKEVKTATLSWSDTDPKFPIKTSARFGKREAKNLPVHPATDEVLMANQVHKKLGYQKYQTDTKLGK